MDVNSSGVFYSTKYEIRAMLKNEGPVRGSIVNISSLAGVRALGPHVAYIASKHAVCGISAAAALEYSPFGIRTNSVGPGFIDTELFQQMSIGPLRADMISRTPLGRLGNPSEIGEVIAFLLSERASYMSGAFIPIEGGILTTIPGAIKYDQK